LISLWYSLLGPAVAFDEASRDARTNGHNKIQQPFLSTMKYLDHSFLSAADNLACDEALLEAAEEDGQGEILRLWEPVTSFVVVGYSNSLEKEVDLERCQKEGVPVFRRCSGGGAVLQSPGCLNYALVLDSVRRGLESISFANQWIMEQQRLALSRIHPGELQVRGHTDLVIGDLKFSGNSQRRKRRFLLFHGSFLLRADLSRMESFLAHPSKEPAYRQGRSHSEFLNNLGVSSASVKQALQASWQAAEPCDSPPMGRIKRMVAEKYSKPEWNLKFL
jgi:lipoate---protein ligase